MRKIILVLAAGLLFSCLSVQAGITTYTFTSASWGSTIGATKCDGKTDGWVSDKAASDYFAGYTDAQGLPYSKGVSVKKGTSGAGATSVLSFTDVRRLTFNFCLNSSSGNGVIYAQVGNNPYDSIIITRPTVSGSGVHLRDSVIHFPTPQSGKIKFWITCTENAINLNSLTIRAEEGGSSPFTQSTFQLVTDLHQLRDSDQVIFGVADGTTNQIMGYYDQTISQNNIHAIKGVYSNGRTIVRENEDAIYTLWKETGENDQDTVYVFQDELRYGNGYLVASGGRTKNKLTLWDDVVSPSYGDFGFWRMTIAQDGVAVIENTGTSERKYMQYNASDKLFGCYADQNSQTKVCLFRKTAAIGTDDPAIVAPLVNFGNIRLGDAQAEGNLTIEVNANKLTEDISCSLKSGIAFSLSASTIDRDGDNLTISYSVSQAGKYIDTLVLTSTGVTTEITVLLNAVGEMTIAQAVQSAEFDLVCLNPVTVTKKYDKYVFVRDETGSMLIYDATNPDTGKPYAQGVENGHVLSNVQGRFRNYFGVPELTPTAVWTVAPQKVTCSPETVTAVDSADVCRYVQIADAVVEDGSWQGVPVLEKFQTGSVIQGVPTTIDAIVMIDHDITQLWVARQGYCPTDINNTRTPMLHIGKYLRGGKLYIRHNGHLYNANGQIIK